ncbi:MAG: FAD-dependent oxidoreductase [Deltaproteobacteria bacterium]|nr:FAD-dependent oxidoreductase [Deltaproteobacteria bacterium]
MSRVVVLGAGVSGHTAASFLKKFLGKKHEVVVVSPNSKWNWIPSNIWVGVGAKRPEDVTFELAPVYKKAGIEFKQAKALGIYPEGGSQDDKPFVSIEYTDEKKAGVSENVYYDYLINATGPKLNFAATEGLGPDKNSLSVCTVSHATQTCGELKKMIQDMKNGKEKRFVIGTGHGTATCQGAAFEYMMNVNETLVEARVRDKAKLTWISNEFEMGDFGMGGINIKKGGYITSGKIFMESLFAEKGISWITKAHIVKVEPEKIHYETLNGDFKELGFDFAMLLPPFAGSGLKAYNKKDEDITPSLFAPNGFMKVDANYDAKSYEEWTSEDWPKTLQNQVYKNIFAVGIAFAPPHAISKPMKSPNGTPIFPAPPRTGTPSAMMGKTVALSITGMIKKGNDKPVYTASMAEEGAPCFVSIGTGFFSGMAASMAVYPVVPDFKRFPDYGRDINLTFGEVGLAGHWIKTMLHYMFLYKAKLKPGWFFIPE